MLPSNQPRATSVVSSHVRAFVWQASQNTAHTQGSVTEFLIGNISSKLLPNYHTAYNSPYAAQKGPTNFFVGTDSPDSIKLNFTAMYT